MNQKTRFCAQQGHEEFEVDHICTYKYCNKSRLCCSLCLNEKIHDHQMSKDHIINIAQLSDKVKGDIENLIKDYLNSEQVILIENLLSYMVKETKKLEQKIIQLRQNLERQLNNLISDDDNFRLQSLLDLAEGNYYLQLNDDEINKLFNINEYKFQANDQLQQNKLYKIEQQLKVLQQNIKNQQENKNNYEIQKIKQLDINEDDDTIGSSTINKKEQLVYNVNDLLHIYDIKMKKSYKSIYQQEELTYFIFTNDSKYLFAGDTQGFVYGFFVCGFKRFYKQQIHERRIKQIITQKQYLITASWDQTIIKTDFINKTQICKLDGHSGKICSIAYDVTKDIIISTSKDESIKIWNCANQSILIDYKHDEYYNGIQLINNNQDIICDSSKKLWKFTIDYQNKKLVKFDFYEEDNNILGFQMDNNDQIIIICEQYTKILNSKLEQLIFLCILYHFIVINKAGFQKQSYVIIGSLELHYSLRLQLNMSIKNEELGWIYYKHIYIHKHKYILFI